MNSVKTSETVRRDTSTRADMATFPSLRFDLSTKLSRTSDLLNSVEEAMYELTGLGINPNGETVGNNKTEEKSASDTIGELYLLQETVESVSYLNERLSIIAKQLSQALGREY